MFKISHLSDLLNNSVGKILAESPTFKVNKLQHEESSYLKKGLTANKALNLGIWPQVHVLRPYYCLQI